MDKEAPHAEDTETKILHAAEKEFLEKGYAGARTATIAEAAGVTHAMLHYYFRTKDKLFERIITEKMTLLGDIVLGAFGDSSLPLAERIRQGVEQHFDFIAANPSLPRFIINEVYAHPERLRIMETSVQGIASRLLGGLQSEIDESVARGLSRPADALMLLVDIISLNLFPVMAAPIVGSIIGGTYESYDAFLAARKQENVETILKKLNIH